jgi:hypothetical protein
LLEKFIGAICSADGAARRSFMRMPRARAFDPQTTDMVESNDVPAVVLASSRWLAIPNTPSGRACWHLAKLAFDDAHDVLEDGEFIGAPHDTNKWMVVVPDGGVAAARFIAYGGDTSVQPDPVHLLSVARSRLVHRFGNWRAPTSEAELLRVFAHLNGGARALVIRGAFVVLSDGHWRGLSDAATCFAKLLRFLSGIACYPAEHVGPPPVVEADACFVSSLAYNNGVVLVVSPGARVILEQHCPAIAAACTPAAWTPTRIGASLAALDARRASQAREREAKKPRL